MSKIDLSASEASVIVAALSEYRTHVRGSMESLARAVSTTVEEFETVVAELKSLDKLKVRIQDVALEKRNHG